MTIALFAIAVVGAAADHRERRSAVVDEQLFPGASNCHCCDNVWPLTETPVALTRSGYQVQALSQCTETFSGLICFTNF